MFDILSSISFECVVIQIRCCLVIIMPGSNSNYIFRIAQSLSRTLYSVIDNMSLVKCGVFFGLGAILSYGFGFSCQITTLLIIATYLATGGWKFIWVVINTLPRDAK